MQDNYTKDTIDPTTFQHKVAAHHNFNKYVDDITVGTNETVIMTSLDVRADPNRTIFVKTTTSCNIFVQLSDDDGDDPIFYDLTILVSGVATKLTIPCNNTTIAVPVFAKAMQMRILLKNNGAASMPYIGVI
jgi:archaellum component FlaF (FlaF/FlaG flagellin family)